MEKLVAYYRERYLEDIRVLLLNMQEDHYKVILIYDMNYDFKEQEIREFYMKIGMINLYEDAHTLEVENLPAT